MFHQWHHSDCHLPGTTLGPARAQEFTQPRRRARVGAQVGERKWRNLPQPGGEDKQEAFGVLWEVCLRFSQSHSENGTLHSGAVSQLHHCPDYSSPHVAPCQVLPELRQHVTLLGLTATLQSCLLYALRSHCCHGMPFSTPRGTSDLCSQ